MSMKIKLLKGVEKERERESNKRKKTTTTKYRYTLRLNQRKTKYIQECNKNLYIYSVKLRV